MNVTVLGFAVQVNLLGKGKPRSEVVTEDQPPVRIGSTVVESSLVKIAGKGAGARLVVPFDRNWKSGFFTYNDIAIGFPLAKKPYERVSLYADEYASDDPRIAREDAGRRGPEGSWHDIRSHGNVTAFAGRGRRVAAIIHRGRTELRRLDILNNGGKHFTFRLEARSHERHTVHDCFELISYRGSSARFWWQEAVEYAAATGVPQTVFRIAVGSTSGTGSPDLYVLGRAGKQVAVSVRRRGKLEDARVVKPLQKLIRSPVHKQSAKLPAARSGLYEVSVRSAQLERRTLFVKKPRPEERGDVLFVFASNAWRSYAMNGHYHGAIDHCFPYSYSYSATLMEGVSDVNDDVPVHSRYPMQPRYYDNMPSGYNRLSAGLVDALERFCAHARLKLAYCGEEDVDDGSVPLEHYRLVILDNHAEYSTEAEMKAIERYMKKGGSFISIGGDAFGRRVDYVRGPDNEVLYQILYRSSIRGQYPKSAQYSDSRRLKRFGICCKANIPPLGKQWLRVAKIDHPITSCYRIGEIITETCWECDEVKKDWTVVAEVFSPRSNRTFPAVAISPDKRMCFFGPMGVSETLAGYYGDRVKLTGLYSRTLAYMLAESRIGGGSRAVKPR